MKLFFFDTETTGTDFNIHGIHQISAIMCIDGKIVDTFNVKLVPWDECQYTDEAMEVTGKTVEQIKANPYNESDAHTLIISKISKYCNRYDKKDKFFMVGFNVHFDNQMLRQLFLRCGDTYFGSFFWSNPIDVMTMATQKLLEHRPFMENFQLMTVAKTFGLLEGKDENFHDALFDIEITKEIYDLLNRNEYKINFEKVLKPVQVDEKLNSAKAFEKSMELLDALEDVKPPVKINTEGNQPKPLRKIDNSNITDLIKFGKYKASSFKNIMELDPQYLVWLHNKTIQGIVFEETLMADIRLRAKIKDDEYERKTSRSFPNLGSGDGYYHSAASQESLDSFGGSDSFDDYPF